MESNNSPYKKLHKIKKINYMRYDSSIFINRYISDDSSIYADNKWEVEKLSNG